MLLATACGGEQPAGSLGAASAALAPGAAVYADALGAEWSDQSSAPHDLSNATPVHSGASSIAVDFAPWSDLRFQTAGLSTAGLTELTLYVNGGASGARRALAVRASIGGVPTPEAALAPYCDGGRIPKNAWVRCAVPLAAIGAVDATIDGIVIAEDAGKSQARMYVDDVSFEGTATTTPDPTPALPAAPTGVAAAATTAGVAVSWAPVSGATGYEVYRSATQTGAETNLTPAPVTAAAYTDTAVVAGSTYWYTVSAIGAAGEGPRSTAVSATVPAPTSTPAQPIYSDAMVSPWADWSWAGVYSLASTAPVASGTRAISVQFGPWEGIYFSRAAFAPDTGSSLRLYVNGGAGGAGAALRVRAVVNGAWTDGADLGPYCQGGAVPANAWVACAVPMSALAPAGAAITGVAVQEWRGLSLPTLYFDDLGVTTSSGSTPAPAPVAVAIGPSSAAVTAGGSAQFTATVSGSTNTAVTWSVQEGAAGGTVTASGLYTAPATAGTYHVVATSAADPSRSAAAAVTVSSPTVVDPPPSGIAGDPIPPERRTTWAPGVPGGVPARTTICATVTPAWASSRGLAAFGTDGSGDAQPAIQAAVNGCAEGQVVYLPAGTYRLNSYLQITKGVTLRGAGKTQTRLRAYLSSTAVIYVWRGWPTWAAAVNVTADVPKGATTIPVADASSFAVGDIVQIDQLDDPSYLFYGGVQYFKRPDYGPATSGPRSMGQTVEVTGKSGNLLTIRPQIHLGFDVAFAAQVFKAPVTVKYAGIEDLYVTGGQNNQIHMMDTAYCWVKGVESDGTVSANPAADGTLGQGNGMRGAHLLVERSFRNEIRDSYFHHATRVVQGGGAYGISLSEHTSDTLVENNIVYYMNKPVTLRASGGGNVIAYNYIDDAWTSADRGLQETTLDLGHASFPYMELAEGNYSPQIATENVWGNSGWMTLFRNYASGKQERTDAFETYQIAAIAMEVKAMYMNVVGNVLGTPGPVGLNGTTMAYEVTSNPPGQGRPAVFRLGHGVGAGSGYDDISTYESPTAPGSTASMMLRAGNWDYVRNQLDVAPATTLPDSLYLAAKPAFFGSSPWPWVDPAGSTKVAVLPAKARFDAGTP
ncbi:glycosyl hydrolase family 28-related protein [Anaeromyxobacter dehalogenans]|uniref:glycosyl hydrolase family 28-related protein n=1 Tax=Anaeromyxobacter dehalogenans TaxID=161493 RepID=UPI0002F1107C|nr:glycosyl hydrolase family 28-related protein [Anaeromyxobacter dehalogenans]